MTYEEIRAQAKVGGFAIIRAPIVMVEPVDREDSLPVAVGLVTCGEAWIDQSEIIHIEPPPETDAEKIARLEARVKELEAQAKRIGTGPFPRTGP